MTADKASVSIRRRWLLITVLALIVQVVALYTPASGDSPFPTPPHTDKVFHAASFAAVTASALLARLPARGVVVAMLVHAVLSELIQWRLLESRSGDLFDFVADAIGIAVGVVIARMILRRVTRGG